MCHVFVKARRNEPTEKLIKRFSKKVKEEKIILEIKERMYYEKPSTRRRKEKARRKRVLDKLKKGKKE
jgi:ribosomal protein S21|tara:strand:- start:208 stop:411 length:204 start_codon:yes stop_codon:yes gene_type:complete